MTTPLVSIIVPTHNDGVTLERCIRSVQAQDWDNIELLVIDDGSTDGTADLLRSLEASCPVLRPLSLPVKSGAAAARNLGFQQAQGEIIALIDGDMWAPPNWVSTLIAPLLSQEAEVTGGPDLVPPDSPLVSRCIGYSMDSLLTNAGLRKGDTRLVKYLPGTGNMAITRASLEQAGSFDETFHDTGEDKEWLHRVRESGARCLYLPEALNWHERRPDLLLHARKQLLSGRRRFDIVRKDRSAFELPHFMPSLLILFLLLTPAIAVLRPLWWGVLLAGTAIVVLDCARGSRQLHDWRAFPILMFSSPVIPFGYGLGILWRGLEVLLGVSNKTQAS
jgi:glycosyltransferase involved in cell wall biosynthesis